MFGISASPSLLAPCGIHSWLPMSYGRSIRTGSCPRHLLVLHVDLLLELCGDKAYLCQQQQLHHLLVAYTLHVIWFSMQQR